MFDVNGKFSRITYSEISSKSGIINDLEIDIPYDVTNLASNLYGIVTISDSKGSKLFTCEGVIEGENGKGQKILVVQTEESLVGSAYLEFLVVPGLKDNNMEEVIKQYLDEYIGDIAVTLIPRNDTSSNWGINDPVLEDGEYGVESDTHRIKRGDGKTVWTELPYETFGIEEVIGRKAADIEYDTSAYPEFEKKDVQSVLDFILNKQETFNAKTTAMEFDIQKLKTDTENQVTDLSDRIDSLEASEGTGTALQDLQDKVTDLETKVNDTTEIDNVKQDIQDLNDRIDSLPTTGGSVDLSGIESDIADINTKVSDLNDKVSVVENNVTTNKNAIADLVNGVTQNAQSITDNTTAINTNKDNINTNKTNIATNTQAISDLNDKVDNLNIPDLTETNQKIQDNTDDITTLNTDMNTAKTDISTNKTDIASIKTQIADIKTDIQELQESGSGGETPTTPAKTVSLYTNGETYKNGSLLYAMDENNKLAYLVITLRDFTAGTIENDIAYGNLVRVGIPNEDTKVVE